MTEWSALNAEFGIKGCLEIRQAAAGLAVIDVTAMGGSASIALQGAQILHWTPNADKPVIWLSPEAKWLVGKSLRGGVPVCWPWFGPHTLQADFPAHGFARTLPWVIKNTTVLDDERVQIQLQLPPTQSTHTWWPQQTTVQMTVIVGGNSLDIELLTHNTDPSPVVVSEALHTYFAVGDVRQARVLGLQGCEYIDKVDNGRRKMQQGPVNIEGEIDRVYLNTDAQCVIEDERWRRRILINKQGSRSTVVWNPWVEKAAKLGDMGAEGYLHMLCVESANALDNSVTIAPGEMHRLGVSYSVEAD